MKKQWKAVIVGIVFPMKYSDWTVVMEHIEKSVPDPYRNGVTIAINELEGKVTWSSEWVEAK